MDARRDVRFCGRAMARLAAAAALSLCASLAAAAAERPGKEAARAEDPPKPSLLDLLLGAGETRRVRDEARKLKDALPDYPHPVKVPEAATILGWIFWGDRPTPPIIFGNAIIIGSGLFVLYRERRLKVEVNTRIEPIP